MSILFEMIRLTAAGYEGFQSTGTVPDGAIEEINEEVDKSWGVLERVLAADSDTQTDMARAVLAIAGGHVLPDAPLDYGGMRLHTPPEVASISAALTALPVAEIERRCRELDFTGVYGAYGATAVEPGADVDSCVAAFIAVRDFYTEAAEKNAALVVFMA